MNEGDIFVIDEVNIELTMPDDTTRGFTLEAPNSESDPFYWEMQEESLSDARYYRDPSLTYQKNFTVYYPVFHFSYGSHRMFTTLLLVSKNIKLKTPPDFLNITNYAETDCYLDNSKAVKDYLKGLPVGAYSAESEEIANPIPSGDLELVFRGREALTWEQALNYYFYQRIDSSSLLASSDEPVSNEELVIHN